MVARTTITVNDGATPTPLARAYEPTIADGIEAHFVRRGTVKLGDEKLSVSLRENGSTIRVKIQLKLPIVSSETVGSATRYAVERQALCITEFVFSDMSTEQERKDALTLMKNVLADTSIIDDVVIERESVY